MENGILPAAMTAMTMVVRKVADISLNMKIHGIKEMTATTLATMIMKAAGAMVAAGAPMVVI